MRLLTLLVAVVAALALFAGSALAATSHPYTGVSFGPDGVAGTESFGWVQGVAVDSVNGDVYVYDEPAGKIYKFDSSGAPKNFTATGTNAISGVGGYFLGEFEIALAPPGAPGGTAGDIYLASAESSVKVYAPSGAPLGEVAQGAKTCGVATDPSGNLYAGVYASTIYRYTPDTNPPTTAHQVRGTVAHKICNVAADGLGNVYAAGIASSNSGLYKLAGIDSKNPIQVDPTAITVGVAPGTNNVYADRENEVAVHAPGGALVDTFGAGEIVRSRGVAVNSTETKIYVGSRGKVKVFGPSAAVAAATTEAATAITKPAATLHGTISAAGGPEATCAFQYTASQNYSQKGFDGAAVAPCSPAGPFTGSGTTAVTAALTGLEPETTYYYRLVGSNENGTVGGKALTFATPGAVNLTTEGATNRTTTSATLNGTINPEGVELEDCYFEFGLAAQEGLAHVPCAESVATIGSGSGPVAVHADVSGLEPGAEYRAQLVAQKQLRISRGGERVFTTRGPRIEAASVAGVGLTSALLRAIINPNSEATTYRFEYVTEAQYQSSGFASATELPAGGEAIGSGSAAIAVEQELAGLVPRTTYYERVIAENAGNTETGPTIRFSALTESASGLPDGRAYEQATPIDKDGGDVQGEHGEVRTSPTGDGITFISDGGIPGAEGAQNLGNFLALRGVDDWHTQGLLPSIRYGAQAKALGLSEDLSTEFTSASVPFTENSTLEISTANRQYTTIYKVEKEAYEAASTYVASDANNGEALFEVNEALNPGDAQFGYANLYLWDRASQRFIATGVMNNGETPEEGVAAGPWDWFYTGGGTEKHYFLQEEHAISADGSRVFFTSLSNRQLYMRVNPTQAQSAMSGETCTEPAKACTYEVSKSQRSTPDPEGRQNAKFLAANVDGSKVFFMSAEDLTNDANTGPSTESNDLYSYDTEAHSLVDLTATNPAENPNGAEVGGILGTSRDGSYVYFVAGGVLAPGATAGHCLYGDYREGICNVYLWHEGTISFLARLETTKGNYEWLSQNWAPADSGTGTNHSSRVSADGKALILYSATNLTDYNSHGYAEFYRYQIGSGQPDCISCSPTGEDPRASATFESITPGFLAPRTFNAKNTRNMSADGDRVFFESSDPLVSTDTNGVKDVYEWEANGTGSCRSEEQNGGCLYLISTGTSPHPTYFGDSSENGNDVFVFTNQPLVGQDRDELVDIYDARVGGGIPSQNPPPPSICTGEACRAGASGAPSSQSPGTSSFSGPGNPPEKQPKKAKKHHKKARHKGHKNKKHRKGPGKHKRGGNR